MAKSVTMLSLWDAMEESLTTFALNTILESSPQHLEVLQLNSVSDVQSVRTLLLPPSLTKLEIINSAVTCKGLQSLLVSSLTSVTLSKCGHLRDEGVISLCSALPGLTYLDINNNDSLTDASLLSGISKLTSLQHLSLLSATRNVTNSGFLSLAGLTRLTYVSMSASYRITSEGLAFLESSLSSLKTLFLLRVGRRWEKRSPSALP
eukprot:PhF_6_TR28131/c3_g4_i4/m.41628